MKDAYFYFIRDVTGRTTPCTIERAAYYLGRSKLPFTHLFTIGSWPLFVLPYNCLSVRKKENL